MVKSNISGIDVEISRKNIKTLRITVKAPNGDVCVSAPLHLPMEEIVRIVASKSDWIVRQQAKVAATMELKAQARANNEGTIFVFGARYPIRLAEGARLSLALRGDEAVFTCPAGCTKERRESYLREWYRARLKEEIARILPKIEAKTGLHASSWQVKHMRTRWGTCNTGTKKIWFSLRLALHPKICLECVILHELIHIKVRNHGAEFQALMDAYMPDWRDVQLMLENCARDTVGMLM